MKEVNLSTLVPLLGSIVLGGCSCSEKSPDPRANILLILADDMGFSDLGCYGSEISTPNLDSLAVQGMRMTQFYNAGRSCPSRACLLTGLYPHQAGIGDMTKNDHLPAYGGRLHDSCATLGEVLKLAGYNTYMVGKWHVGDDSLVRPKQRGFDKTYHLTGGAGNYFRLEQYRPNTSVRMFENNTSVIPDTTAYYRTNDFTDHALQMLEDEKKEREPFFMYLAYTAPHWPLHALPEDIERYRGKYMAGWDTVRAHRFKKQIDLGIFSPSVKLPPRADDIPLWDTLSQEEKEKWDLRMAVYAAMVDRLDQNIGRIIAKLREMGELDNTLILFLSDNGGCHEGTKHISEYLKKTGTTGTANSFDGYEKPWAYVSNTPFRMYKHWTHEGGIATPFIARFPSFIKTNSMCHVPLHIIDIMPTVLELTSIDYPEVFRGVRLFPLQGISIIPFLKGKSDYGEDHHVLFWEHEGNRALRKGDWKIVSLFDMENNRHGKWEMYNMRTDRTELNDQFEQFPVISSLMTGWYDKVARELRVVSFDSIRIRRKEHEKNSI